MVEIPFTCWELWLLKTDSWETIQKHPIPRLTWLYTMVICCASKSWFLWSERALASNENTCSSYKNASFILKLSYATTYKYSVPVGGKKQGPNTERAPMTRNALYSHQLPYALLGTAFFWKKTTPKKTTTSQKELHHHHHHHYSSHLITMPPPHGLQVSGALLSKARQEAQNASAVNSVMDTFPFAKVSPDRPLAQSLSFDSFVRSTERVPLASHHRVEAATGLGEDRVNVGLYARSGSSPHRGRSYGLTFWVSWALTLLMELSLETQLCLPKNWFNDTFDQWNNSGKAGKSDRTFEPIIAKHESYNWIRWLMVTSLTKILHLNPSNKSASRNNRTPTAPPTAPIRCTVYRLDGATSPSNERTSWLCLYHHRTSHSKHQTSGNKLTNIEHQDQT